jgi:hypothetical protein
MLPEEIRRPQGRFREAKLTRPRGGKAHPTHARVRFQRKQPFQTGKEAPGFTGKGDGPKRAEEKRKARESLTIAGPTAKVPSFRRVRIKREKPESPEVSTGKKSGARKGVPAKQEY